MRILNNHLPNHTDEVLVASEFMQRSLAITHTKSQYNSNSVSPSRPQSLQPQWLQQQGVPALPASQLEKLSLRLESGAPSGAADLAGGWQLSWKGAELVLQQREAEH